MEVNAVTSGVSQLVQQSPQQSQVRTASNEAEAERARAQQQRDEAQQRVAQQPVVNTSGQVTGSIVNTSA